MHTLRGTRGAYVLPVGAYVRRVGRWGAGARMRALGGTLGHRRACQSAYACAVPYAYAPLVVYSDVHPRFRG